LGDLIDDLEKLVRRYPGLVFGGMLVAGFAAGRFFKASSSRKPSRTGSEGRRGSTSSNGTRVANGASKRRKRSA
jgi:hypothetical protein